MGRSPSLAGDSLRGGARRLQSPGTPGRGLERRRRDVQPISAERRRVVNIRDGEFIPFLDSAGREDGSVLQVNPNKERGYGFPRLPDGARPHHDGAQARRG